MLLIRDEQVASVLSVKDCLDAMEMAFQDLARGEAVDTLRDRLFVRPSVDFGVYSMGHQCGIPPRFNIAAIRVTSHRIRTSRDPRDNYFVLCASKTSQSIFDGHWIAEGALVISSRNGDRNRISGKERTNLWEMQFDG